MKAKEYFGEWIKVIDIIELNKIIKWLSTVNPNSICPSKENIFRAFEVCPYKELRVVCLGLDPYPQPGIAQGILFGNSKDTPEHLLSPSLKVIKECAINYSIPHNYVEFDNTLESWAKQGILLINSAFTCEVNKVGSHTHIWYSFTAKLLRNISLSNNGLVFILFGNQAQSFKPYIKGFQKIIEVQHPAYFARRNEIMPYSTFTEVNKFLKAQYNEQIKFYKEC